MSLLFRLVVLVVFLGLPESVALAGAHHLMRYADVHGDRIVFTYENDLWLVSTEGGLARRITRDPGAEGWAKFSPDGSLLAFTGQYDGGTDVYVMETAGGAPRRLTFHPARDRVLGWWPDGKSILFRSNRVWPSRGEEVYRVALEGGLPERLSVDRAGLTAVSPDGTRIAYNRISREARTWKRHRGGTAQDIWMGSLAKHDYRKIVDTDWSDNFPMWRGETIFFTSDRQFGTLNIHAYDVNTGAVTRLTDYRDYDVKYPSLGVDRIVYQHAESLELLDLRDGKTRTVPVEIPSDSVRVRPEFITPAPSSGSFGLSPSGKRVLIEARGEILDYPAKEGQARNLTASPGSREKNAAWSPDGRWVAFLSDRTGEEEIYLVDPKAPAEWRRLTTGGYGFRMHLVWSPDSKKILFGDKFLRLNMADAETGAVTLIDQADYDDAWERWGIQDYVWSPGSRWIAYTKMEESQYDSIFLYSLEQKRSVRLTGSMTEDWSPSFDPQGRYLYFLSNRTFHPVMGFVDQTHVFLDMARPYLILLHADSPSPFAPKDSEEEVAAEKKEGNEAPADDSPGEPEAPKDAIDHQGIERRVVVAKGVPSGKLFRLEATKKGFLFLRKEANEFLKYQAVTDETGGRLDLYHYDLDATAASKVLSGIANYHLSADLQKCVYRAGGTYGVVDAGKPSSVGKGKVALAAVRIVVDRAKEFLQEFNEAWRIERDWFYDPGLHGLDWKAVGEKYRKFVGDCGNRSDLTYLIGEMISELNIGHTYVYGGDVAHPPKRVSVGLLGADLLADDQAGLFRIGHIIQGVPGDPAQRSPLDEPGCGVAEGDYLIAIDGHQVKTDSNPYAFLLDKAGKVVRLTVNDKPGMEGAHTERVTTVSSEGAIRYREWVEHNRAYVDKMTDGRVGYLHIPDMMERGLIEFAKVWYPLHAKDGFVIDERYNTGGFVGDMIIDRLERRLWAMTKPREGMTSRNPERAFYGPWVVLINEDTGSNGEFFAEAIKLKKLARLIGMRTWGGAIGIEPHQLLVDGGTVTPPQFGLYGLDGSWLIEGHGVDPDFEVQNLPGDVLAGKDAQLDAAIGHVMEALQRRPAELPGPPPYPDKSKKD